MIDYENPDYTDIFIERKSLLDELNNDPVMVSAFKTHYRSHPWAYINDFGMTFEPRNVEAGLIASIPFVLWEKQNEYLKWLYTRWKSGERGLVEKSRDCGVTWLSVGFAVSMFLFEPGFVTGFGSRKEELVDKRGDDKSIFEKLRFFLKYTPEVFLPENWDERTCSAYMRVQNPQTSAAIIGEAGDQIGRGGRASIYFVDEAAFVERQEAVDAALSQNTNCQIDISTPNGNGNLFYKKRQRFNNTDRIFIFDWRDDPRKDDDWYQKQKEEQDDVTVAQEIDRDYNASQEDVFIPAKWVAASIDAHLKLGFIGEGIRVTSFDPADTGDAKAIINRHGSVIKDAKQLKQGNITHAMPWAFAEADDFRADTLVYDGDGMGAPSMKLYLERISADRVSVIAYHGSAGVMEPGEKIEKVKKARKNFKEGKDNLTDILKTNADTYENFRSQTWTWARNRFEATYYAIQRAEEGLLVNVDPEDLISIDSQCECLLELQAELSRPKRIWSRNGKIQVESKKDMKSRNVDSPNLADGAIMAMSVRRAVAVKKKKRPKVRPRRMMDRGMGS